MVVMYHYVRKSVESSPQGVRPLLTSEFEEQLDWLDSNFRIVAPEEFLVELGGDLGWGSKPPCLLTFDDGTKDHLEVVAPVLQNRSLPALFFVLTWPIEHQWMPVTQALHWALGQPEDQLWEKLKDFAKARLGGVETLGSAEDAIRAYHYETRLRALIKYAVNFAMPFEAAQELLEQLVDAEGMSISNLANQWFLMEEEVKQLHTMGMSLGMHGCSHKSFAQLGGDGIRNEIRHSSAYLTQLLGEAPTWFAAPFGGAGFTGDMDLIYQSCREVGVTAIVTARNGLVDRESDQYEIPRVDCVYLPPRSRELIAG